ncbi:aminoacyl-tRNA hydrolase [Cellulophaga sp. E16_2]|uniref:Class I peptide chain release factor n=1 Tax=Cellulophaga algicola (strain DSM 14237 / IC166 / ACAM 630) TaxID=688270 RepID=E6X844_CELAD|nr:MULTISPECIES: alternative ribosome rescue aminoacyl-tRNA hydrolase ArfB [Cellulophaga]ADV48642.1 Class I peptide chain release factor [Cellulophaga algicola DSM 14237]MBO0591096.1 aminoacyl-tRNA hydrolase [Cellulophaga sp. E16_2]
MNKELIVNELQFKAVRSSGAGGQHVNKVSTKIELFFDVVNSTSLNILEKEKIYLKLKNKLNKEHVLQLQCDESRSQHKNKTLAIKRFLGLLENALKEPKKRKRTKPSRSSIEKRLHSKKKAAEKKANRTKNNW